jgi:hypothetical protein
MAMISSRDKGAVIRETVQDQIRHGPAVEKLFAFGLPRIGARINEIGRRAAELLLPQNEVAQCSGLAEIERRQINFLAPRAGTVDLQRHETEGTKVERMLDADVLNASEAQVQMLFEQRAALDLNGILDDPIAIEDIGDSGTDQHQGNDDDRDDPGHIHTGHPGRAEIGRETTDDQNPDVLDDRLLREMRNRPR